MRDALAWFFDAITHISWLELMKALAQVATSLIAFSALKNWQRQDKAKQRAEFLDALIEATHTYTSRMHGPIMHFETVQAAINWHPQTWESREEANKAVEDTIAYIQKHGKTASNHLQEALGTAQPTSIKLRLLTTKGEMFNFDGYAKCLNAANGLLKNYEDIGTQKPTSGSTARAR